MNYNNIITDYHDKAWSEVRTKSNVDATKTYTYVPSIKL